MKLELTEAQIEIIIAAKKAVLDDAKEKAIEKILKQYDKDVEKLKLSIKPTFEYEIKGVDTIEKAEVSDLVAEIYSDEKTKSFKTLMGQITIALAEARKENNEAEIEKLLLQRDELNIKNGKKPRKKK